MTDTKINLPQKTIGRLIKIFSTYPEIEKAMHFWVSGKFRKNDYATIIS